MLRADATQIQSAAGRAEGELIVSETASGAASVVAAPGLISNAGGGEFITAIEARVRRRRESPTRCAYSIINPWAIDRTGRFARTQVTIGRWNSGTPRIRREFRLSPVALALLALTQQPEAERVQADEALGVLLVIGAGVV